MKLDRFQRWAVLTTFSTYLLIGIGGLVRASGAGLGCPDWPKCFGRWIPPLSVDQVPSHIDPALFNVAKAWTEYLNRLAGVVVGICIFITLVLALKMYRRSRRIVVSTVSAFLLVMFEGWLGGQVVASNLKPVVLTIHMVFALVIVSLLLYATVIAFFPEGQPVGSLPASRRRLGWVALGSTILLLVQVALGAYLRGELQEIAKQMPAARGSWLPSVGMADVVHQNFAYVAALSVLWVAWEVFFRAERDRWLRLTMTSSLVFLVLQIGSGLGLFAASLPATLQVLHLWTGSLLLGAMTVLCLLVFRLDPREARGPMGARSGSLGSAQIHRHAVG